MGKQYKKECRPLEQGDLSDTLSMAIDCSLKRNGRPAAYPTTPKGIDDFIQKTIDYFDFVRVANMDDNADMRTIPDVESWCVYCGITRTTLFSYRKRGGEWQQCIDYYMEVIAACKKQLALNYKVPPVAFVFDFTNNHNYLNSSEFKLEQTINQKEQTELNHIEAELQQKGIQWNEVTHRYEPIQMIGVDHE